MNPFIACIAVVIIFVIFMTCIELYEHAKQNKMKETIKKILFNAGYQVADLEIIAQAYFNEINDTHYFLVKNAGQLICIKHHISVPDENKFFNLSGTKGKISLQLPSQWSLFDYPYVSVDTDIEGWYIGSSWMKGD
ncbi:MAG: hypothetical protein WC823_06785 [Parcubacteria group bacterium]